MINCTAKAVKRSVTAVALSDARWISDWLAATLPVTTCTVRTASITTSNSSVQATKPVKARTEGVIVSPSTLASGLAGECEGRRAGQQAPGLKVIQTASEA